MSSDAGLLKAAETLVMVLVLFVVPAIGARYGKRTVGRCVKCGRESDKDALPRRSLSWVKYCPACKSASFEWSKLPARRTLRQDVRKIVFWGSTSPAELRAEVTSLRAKGLGDEVLVDYIARTKIIGAVTSEEVIRWRSAGYSDMVIRALIARGRRGW